jgi:hypothetical protein
MGIKEGVEVKSIGAYRRRPRPIATMTAKGNKTSKQCPQHCLRWVPRSLERLGNPFNRGGRRLIEICQ